MRARRLPTRAPGRRPLLAACDRSDGTAAAARPAPHRERLSVTAQRQRGREEAGGKRGETRRAAATSRRTPPSTPPSRPTPRATRSARRVVPAPDVSRLRTHARARRITHLFWKRARAPGPPNFFGSVRRGSATRSVRSNCTRMSRISFFDASSTYFW